MSRPAAAPDVELRLEALTTGEVAERLRSGFTRVIVPCGAIEQHGPHMALSMDAEHADALGARAARALGGTLVAPTIRVGCSAHHLAFAGTISLEPATFEAVCVDYCRSLARHGFTEILFFSGHIGNFPYLADMLPRLNATVSGAAEVRAFHDSEAWMETWREAVRNSGGDAGKVGGHADIAETSIMLALRPEAVRSDHVCAGKRGRVTAEDLTRIWRDGFASVSPNGVLGDATGSTSAIGEACLDAVTGLLTRSFATPVSDRGRLSTR